VSALIHFLQRDQKGAAIVEFAMVAPVLLLAVMGLFDMAYNMYTGAVMQGAVQKTARDSTIEGAGINTATLDARVTAAVRRVMPQANLGFARSYYTSFSKVSQPEDYNDVNGNGSCDNGEPFEDANGNGRYDTDRGSSGQGGARDAVLYTVTVTYPRVFPLAKMIGLSSQVTTSTATVLRNQPYGLQTVQTPVTRNC
jgi:Flp pilus assembly protein TadG